MATVEASLVMFDKLEKAMPRTAQHMLRLVSRIDDAAASADRLETSIAGAADGMKQFIRQLDDMTASLTKAGETAKALSNHSKSRGHHDGQSDKSSKPNAGKGLRRFLEEIGDLAEAFGPTVAALASASQIANDLTARGSGTPAGTAAVPEAAPADAGAAAAQGPTFAERMAGGVDAMNQGLQVAQQLWGQLTQVMDYSDRIQSVNLQLALANDGLRTQVGLHRQVMNAANGSNASYETTAALVGKLSQAPGAAFETNDAAVAFAGQFNKVMAASGVQAEGRSDVSNDMAQAMGGGGLDGGALQSLSEQASLLPVILADGLGVARGELMAMAEAGELTSEVIASAFNNQSQRIDEMFANTPATFGEAMTLMKNHAASWMSGLQGAEGPMQRITQLVMSLSAWLSSDAGQQLFQGLSVGATVFVDVMASAVQLLIDNMAIVQYVLLAVGIVLAALAVQWLVTWLTAIWPILLIIGALAGIMVVLDMLGVSAGEVVGFLMGIFGSLFAFLWNAVAFLYNPFVAFAEFLVNLFNDPVYAVQKLFYDLAANSMAFFNGMINELIEGLNWLIDKMNDIPGIQVPLIPLLEEDLSKALAPPKSDKNVVDFSKYKMGMMDQSDTFGAWNDKGVQMFDKAADALSGYSMEGIVGKGGSLSGERADKPGLHPDIDKVNEVGSIDDTVDISSEELKIMRDLAELDAIQNFVTLTPTVQVTTGPIMKEVDVDEVIKQITSTVEREIESSAQGIYRL
jgi:tape measure domain-containing protein